MSLIKLPMVHDYHLNIPENLTMKYLSSRALRKDVAYSIKDLSDQALTYYDLLIKESCLNDRDDTKAFVAHTIHETIAHEITMRYLRKHACPKEKYPETVRYSLETYDYIRNRYGEDESNIYLTVAVERFTNECFFETSMDDLCAYHHTLMTKIKKMDFVLWEFLSCIEDAITSKVNYQYIKQDHLYDTDLPITIHLQNCLEDLLVDSVIPHQEDACHEYTL